MRPARQPDVGSDSLWIPNARCVPDMVLHVGFVNIEEESARPGAVFRARVPEPGADEAPDQMKAPWC
jgi:hypothetical protein